MDIQGLEKMTLLDWPGKVACTVFLGGCNFRCPFCHNSGLIDGPMPEALSTDLFFAFLEKRRGLLDGVCVTGGEPLLRPDLAQLLERIKSLGYAVKLDTNGSQPGRLTRLCQAGLVDYVAMDIKNSPARYALTCGLEGMDLEPVRQSAACLMSGKVDYEFRTTVVRQFHTREDMLEIGRWLSGARRYFLQAFVARNTVPRQDLTPYSRAEMENFVRVLSPFIPAVSLRGI